MKAKYAIKKEGQKTKFKRTLNLGNRLKSQTAIINKKNLTIATNENINNNIILKNSSNKKKYNTIVLPKSQTNKKLAINNHIVLKSKDINIKTPGIKRCTTEQNKRTINSNKKKNLYTKLPKINYQNNIIIYKKINSFSSKKNSQTKTNHPHIIFKSKNKEKKDHSNLTQKTMFRTPLRIRKNGSNGGIFQKLISDKSNVSIIESNYTNKLLIENLEKELEFLKKEKEYKNNMIEKLKEQINESRNKQEIIKENKKLKKEIKILKANIKNVNEKIYDDIDLFDKFKNEYINKKNKVIQLKNENDALIKKLDYKRYNNLQIRKNIEINYIPHMKKKKQIKKLNNKSHNYNNNNLNKYIEKKYKSDLESEGENINNYTKLLNLEQIKEIRYLIKMIFYSNKITKDKLLNLIIKNLMNFNDMIYSFIQLIKTNSPSDIILLKNYFTFICFNNNSSKIKIFNINNIFNEINLYFNDIEKIKTEFDFLNNSNDKINQLIKECKYKDKYNKGKGTIELKQFNSIFNDIYGNFNKNLKVKEIYDTYIYIMKNKDNLDKLNLYELSYKNININISQSIQDSNIDEIKSSKESKEESSNNISSSNIEEADSKICSNFINDLFNDCLNGENENEEDNNNNPLYKVCQDFVKNVFDECRDRNKKKNIKICQDFVSDVFDFCLKKNKINEMNIIN